MGSGRFSMMSVGFGDLEPRMLMAMSVGILHLIVLQLFISVQVEAMIIEFVVPGHILIANEATMQCRFDDDFGNMVRFYWSSSPPDVIERADADELLSYDVINDDWIDFTSGRFTATMNRTAKSSSLILGSAELDDEKKYWCIIQVFGNTWVDSGVAKSNALNKSAKDHLLWLDEDEVESSISLKDATYQFECRVIGAKPAPNITLTFGGEIVSNPDTATHQNLEDPRLFDSISTFSVTINSEFEEKDLTCKATVPADETGVSDTVTITRDSTSTTSMMEKEKIMGNEEDTGKKLTEGEKWGIGVGVVAFVAICAGVAVGSKKYMDKK